MYFLCWYYLNVFKWWTVSNKFYQIKIYCWKFHFDLTVVDLFGGMIATRKIKTIILINLPASLYFDSRGTTTISLLVPFCVTFCFDWTRFENFRLSPPTLFIGKMGTFIVINYVYNLKTSIVFKVFFGLGVGGLSPGTSGIFTK